MLVVADGSACDSGSGVWGMKSIGMSDVMVGFFDIMQEKKSVVDRS